MNWEEVHSTEFQKFVQDHLQEDPALLLFKYQGKPNFDLKAAVHQIAARQKISKKLPSWAKDPNLVFPASISLEQSSSEETALFKSKGLSGKWMIDLTGGFGVDSFYLSQGFEKGTYCEYQEELAQIVSKNLEYLAPGKFEIVTGDGLAFLLSNKRNYDLIYVDPARRGKGNQKLYKLQDCQPDVVSVWDQLKEKAQQILIKASPMLDISQAFLELPDLQLIQIVSSKNEVKELLLHWKKGGNFSEKRIEAHDLGSNQPTFSFSMEQEEKAVSEFGEITEYLIEPMSGILKAGAFKLFGNQFKLKKLEPNSHIYTSDFLPENIPGRVFKVIQEVSANKKEIKKLFPKGKANVITRNYLQGANDLKKKLGLKDGGEDFLIGTKTSGGYKLVWCKRVK
ncbi:class I SAM-dependent methyltransferase [Algoriphagus lutimaris]|uniref:class I SAM-dependent methyltransferase n=1 Tax=Algoriphagus lutimaris TaxID=613197 RepID=UPI00196B8B38|nr:class I SAM-dependent methyltransferase [Algoriphagus lutimaris]MBN3520731.1 class I SAM-dependent methyltransferase [Algoriphagus lutimaris]